MVSLLKLAEITEEGVNFESPYDGSQKLLTPEESIRIQNSIGADIMMQVEAHWLAVRRSGAYHLHRNHRPKFSL